MKRALITGSMGFVGRHFTRRLVSDGWEVTRCDILGNVGPYESGVAWLDCRQLFAENSRRYDLVIHCAAIVGGRATIEGQPMAVATDLAIDADLWQWALRTRPGRVVYFSSSAAYPIHLQGIVGAEIGQRLHEGLLRPTACYETADQTYGLAKLVGEIQAAHVRNEGVPVTVIRPFSGYGEDQSLDYPFPSFIARAAAHEDPFTIWGDGQQVRDWIHIDDIVELTMRCVDQGVDGPINACTGRDTSFDELAAIVCQQAGYQPELQHLTDAPSGVRYRVGDPTAMHEVWRPRIPLEEGVARALAVRSAA